MDISEDRLTIDESLKEMRLPVIEAAVLAVQGYTEPVINIDNEQNRLMKLFTED